MATNSNTARIVYRDNFDGRGISKEDTLANALLTKPDMINPVITHLAGREDKKFPLSFLTEGQNGGVRTIELNDQQYKWKVFRRLRRSDSVVSTSYSGSDKPGIANTRIIVVFETNWLKNQHTIESPNGYQLRIQRRPTQIGNNYRYELAMQNPDPAAYIPLTELAAGVRWGMVGGAPVSEALSWGNESNVVTPGEMKNQVTFLRKSYRWAGNYANKKVECEFTIAGVKTNLFMDFERWQHTLDWKQVCEEHYWYSKYNRRADGQITLFDDETNEPIPIGAGVLDQIPNTDTYSTLSALKLKNTVGDVFYGNTDTGNMNVILYTGLGGMDEFDKAMKEDLKNYTLLPGSDKFVMGSGRNLILGGFFTTYQHVDGHTVTVRHLPLLDFGGRAEISPKHPITGRPLSSYDMYFIDMSAYDGQNNVQMATIKGQAMITGVLKGMAPTPMDFAGNDSEVISTEQDVSSIHFKSAKSIFIRRNTSCFKLNCSIS